MQGLAAVVSGRSLKRQYFSFKVEILKVVRKQKKLNVSSLDTSLLSVPSDLFRFPIFPAPAVKASACG